MNGIDKLPLNENPELSVVIPTRRQWPHIRETLEPLLAQAGERRVEIIVADTNGNALPENVFPEVVRVSKPGASVFRLYALGAKQARGNIIAFTEDHCMVSADWCERIITAHQENPEVDVISGVIENGSTDSLVNRIHFLFSKGPLTGPVTSSDASLISGEANISFKKDALPKDIEEIDFRFYQSIHKRGLKTLMRDDIVVRHFQSVGFARSCGIHFHNGRTIAGFRLTDLNPVTRLLRVAGCAILPLFLTARAFAAAFRKRRERLAMFVGLPLLILLSICHSAGECIGYLSGAGNSPQKIH